MSPSTKNSEAHEAAHVAVACWLGLPVRSVDMEHVQLSANEVVVEGVRLAPMSSDADADWRLALFYLAPRVFEEKFLNSDPYSASFGSIEDDANASALLAKICTAQNGDRGRVQVLAEEQCERILKEKPVRLQIERIAELLRHKRKLGMEEIYLNWEAAYKNTDTAE